MRKTLFLMISIALLAAACGDDTPPAASGGDQTDSQDGGDAPDADADADEVVFIWAETGGCAMAGPNCARYEITAAGDVSTYREGEAEVAATGTVDQVRVADWLEVVGNTDIEEFVARLGPGEMKAAFDGIDYTLQAPSAGLNISSVDVDFSSPEQVFKHAWSLADLAADAAPLDLKQR